MSQDIDSTPKIKIEKALTTTGTFINFEVKREGWSLYKIEDGSLLRARVILSGFLMQSGHESIAEQIKQGKKPEITVNFRSRTLFAVESPPKLRGEPNPKPYTIKELKESIIDEDMDFETIKEVWNLYELENGITLKARLSVVAINKTDKFDNTGVPAYTVDSSVDVKVQLSDHTQRLLKERRI